MKTYIQLFRHLLSAKTLSRALIIILSLGAFPVQAMLASKGMQALAKAPMKSLVNPLTNPLAKNLSTVTGQKKLKLSNLLKTFGGKSAGAPCSSLVSGKYVGLQQKIRGFVGISSKRKFHSQVFDTEASSMANSSVYQRSAAGNKGILAALAALAGAGYVYAECQDGQAEDDRNVEGVQNSDGTYMCRGVRFSGQEWREIVDVSKKFGFNLADADRWLAALYSGSNPYHWYEKQKWIYGSSDICSQVNGLIKSNDTFARFVLCHINKEFLIQSGSGKDSLVKLLVDVDQRFCKRIVSLVDEQVIGTWLQSKGGQEAVLKLLTLNVLDGQVIKRSFTKEALSKLTKIEDGFVIFKTLIDKDKSLVSLLPDRVKDRAFNDPWGLASENGGNRLLSSLYKAWPKEFEHVSETATWNHLINCEFCPPIPNEFTANPELRGMLQSFVKMEREYQDKYYTFIHGQRRDYYLPMKLQTLLWSVHHNKPLGDDYVFPHIKSLPTPSELENEEIMRKRIFTESWFSEDKVRLTLCMNRSFFGNSTLFTGSSAYYISNNINCENIACSYRQIFEYFGRQDVYERYKVELDELDREYKQLSNYGNSLFVAIPKERASDLVFLARPGGVRTDIAIKGWLWKRSTSDIHEVIETLNHAPDRLIEKEAIDQNQFGMFMGYASGAQNPDMGVKIIPLVSGDVAKLGLLEEKRKVLFANIVEAMRSPVGATTLQFQESRVQRYWSKFVEACRDKLNGV